MRVPCLLRRLEGAPLGVQPVAYGQALLVAGSWAAPGLGMEEGPPCCGIDRVVRCIERSPAPGFGLVLGCVQPASGHQQTSPLLLYGFCSSCCHPQLASMAVSLNMQLWRILHPLTHRRQPSNDSMVIDMRLSKAMCNALALWQS